jgi:hypothetical protein
MKRVTETEIETIHHGQKMQELYCFLPDPSFSSAAPEATW